RQRQNAALAGPKTSTSPASPALPPSSEKGSDTTYTAAPTTVVAIRTGRANKASPVMASGEGRSEERREGGAEMSEDDVAGRRRNTSFSRDWSADVCSSDLRQRQNAALAGPKTSTSPASPALPPSSEKGSDTTYTAAPTTVVAIRTGRANKASPVMASGEG